MLLKIKVVIGQLPFQTPLFQEVVDGTALAQIGFRHLDGRFGIFCFCRSEIVFYVQLFFASTHKVNSRLGLPLALLISIISWRVKKIFSIDA
ncbi:hypothetical protein AO265_24450 [Pseudomonas sp. ABAC61]|nr:hypothetical protein AO265_24450 [Pseudomonas sp. ABAC61]